MLAKQTILNKYKENMKMVELDLTGTCNLNCPLCARNYKALNDIGQIFYQERSVNEIMEQLEQFPNLNKVNLVGATSEPTLYKDIFKLIKALHNRSINIEICTNGTGRDQTFWKLLAFILTKDDSVYFSICGSTQELHEKYRVGSDLTSLLNNAWAFKHFSNNKKNDYIQHILFDYNKDDLESDKMKDIISGFSNVNYTKTYFTRPIENYIDTKGIGELDIHNDDIEYYNAAIKHGEYIVSNKTNKKYTIQCESIDNNNIHINQAGNIYPCYIWLEDSGHKLWDGDYKKILDFEYDCCRYCEKNLKEVLAAKGCELL